MSSSDHTMETHDGAAAASGFHALLKTGTQDLHDLAEAAPLQRKMVDGSLGREQLAAFLGQLWHVHDAFDPLLRESAARDARLAEMVTGEHVRRAKIESDLEDLGARVPAERLPATDRFVAFIRASAERDPVSMIGVLYVKEGATNGNKIVAKRLRDSLGLSRETAMGYLDPYGRDQRRLWNDFKAKLDTLDLSADERARCLEAARATFRLFMDLSNELAEAATSH